MKNQFPLLVIVPVKQGNMKGLPWLLRTDPLARVIEPLSPPKASGMALKSIIPVWQGEVNLSVRVIILKYLAGNTTFSSVLPETTRTTS